MTAPRLRGGYRPPPRAIVVRGGAITSSNVAKDVEKCLHQWGIAGISIAVADVPTVADLMRQVNPFVARMKRVSITSVGVLEDWGCELLATSQSPHYTLVIRSIEPTALDDLCLLFRVVENPLHEGIAR